MAMPSLNSLSVTDATPPTKQMNVAVSRRFIAAIVTMEQKSYHVTDMCPILYKQMYDFLEKKPNVATYI